MADRCRRSLTQRGGPTHAVVGGGAAAVRAGRRRGGGAPYPGAETAARELSASEPNL